MAGWFYQIDGRETGPIDTTELKRLASCGELARTSLIRKEEMKEWVAAEMVKGLFNTRTANQTSPRSLTPVMEGGVVKEEPTDFGVLFEVSHAMQAGVNPRSSSSDWKSSTIATIPLARVVRRQRWLIWVLSLTLILLLSFNARHFALRDGRGAVSNTFKANSSVVPVPEVKPQGISSPDGVVTNKGTDTSQGELSTAEKEIVTLIETVEGVEGTGTMKAELERLLGTKFKASDNAPTVGTAGEKLSKFVREKNEGFYKWTEVQAGNANSALAKANGNQEQHQQIVKDLISRLGHEVQIYQQECESAERQASALDNTIRNLDEAERTIRGQIADTERKIEESGRELQRIKEEKAAWEVSKAKRQAAAMVRIEELKQEERLEAEKARSAIGNDDESPLASADELPNGIDPDIKKLPKSLQGHDPIRLHKALAGRLRGMRPQTDTESEEQYNARLYAALQKPLFRELGVDSSFFFPQEQMFSQYQEDSRRYVFMAYSELDSDSIGMTSSFEEFMSKTPFGMKDVGKQKKPEKPKSPVEITFSNAMEDFPDISVSMNPSTARSIGRRLRVVYIAKLVPPYLIEEELGGDLYSTPTIPMKLIGILIVRSDTMDVLARFSPVSVNGDSGLPTK